MLLHHKGPRDQYHPIYRCVGHRLLIGGQEGQSVSPPPGERAADQVLQVHARYVRRTARREHAGPLLEPIRHNSMGTEPTGTRLHTDLQELATEHVGSMLAAEWFGPLGWTRFMWCKR